MKRRSFLMGATALPFVTGMIGSARATEALAEAALANGETEVIFAGGTGAYGERVRKYILDPFTAETGIKVIEDGGSTGEKLAKLKAMGQVGQFDWDVVTLLADSLVPDNTQYLMDLGGGSCDATPNVAANGVAGACLQYGVLFDLGGGVMAYNSVAFPDAGREPGSWADFWDAETFPGPRALPNIGSPWWPMIAALIADGVSPDELFPLDVDRAFEKLDEIKPHVAVWWTSGDQSQQIFRSGEVVMAQMYAGRAIGLGNEGLPIGVSWNGAPLDAAAWCVVKEAAHPNAAKALINYMYTRPEAHAQFAAESGGVTAMRDAYPLLPAEVQRTAATAPQNWEGIVQIDKNWLGQNHAELLERWTAWVAS